MKSITGTTLSGQHVEIPLDALTWRPGVYAIIFDQARNLLVTDNIRNGKYDLPGGGIETWETMPEALAREVWEETGLTIQVGQLAGISEAFFVTPGDKHWHTINIFYTAEILDGKLRETIIEGEHSVNPHWIDIANCHTEQFTIGWETVRAVYDAII